MKFDIIIAWISCSVRILKFLYSLNTTSEFWISSINVITQETSAHHPIHKPNSLACDNSANRW